MMRRTPALGFLVAAGALALVGCGTCGNLLDVSGALPEDKVNRVYGGVQLDLEESDRLRADPPAGTPVSATDSLERLARRCYLLGIDLPLSCVADTVTLPITACAAWEAKVGAPSGLSSGHFVPTYVSPVRASAKPDPEPPSTSTAPPNPVPFAIGASQSPL